MIFMLADFISSSTSTSLAINSTNRGCKYKLNRKQSRVRNVQRTVLGVYLLPIYEEELAQNFTLVSIIQLRGQFGFAFNLRMISA